MRPVRQERRVPKQRGSTGRLPSRGIVRGSAPQSRRSRSGGSFFTKLLALLAAIVRRPMLALALGVIILTAIAAVVVGKFVDRTVSKTGVVVAHAGFGIAQVHLEGNVRTKPVEIMAALGLTGGESMFAVNLRTERQRLLRLPWVADAEVKRHYPDDISVLVVERVPYARWQTEKGSVLVERKGRVITSDSPAFAKLPLLVGDGAPENAPVFVEAVSRHRAIVNRVTAYQYQSRRRWNLILNDGVIVKLPEDGWEKELGELDHLIIDKGILESDIREIDLRHPNFLFFVRRNGVEQKEKKTETGSAI